MLFVSESRAAIFCASSEGFENDLWPCAEVEGGECVSEFMHEEAEEHDGSDDDAFECGVSEDIGEKKEEDPEGGVDMDGDVEESKIHGVGSW